MNWAEIIFFVHRLLARASSETLLRFRTPIEIEAKKDQSPVTIADRSAEQVMREMICSHYPHHGIVGEEFDVHQLDREFVWVLDPIDGTRSFISGNPLFSTLVALVYRGEAVLGVIDVPALKERWVGIDTIDQRQTWFNNTVCHVSAITKVSESTLVTTSAPNQLNSLKKAVRQVNLGGDAFAYGCLASGYCHLVVDAQMEIYDYLPLVPIVRAAGGAISDWQGQPLTLEGGQTNVLAASTKMLQTEAVLALAS